MSRPIRFSKSRIHYQCEGHSDGVGCFEIYSFFPSDLLRYVDGRWVCYDCFKWASLNSKHTSMSINNIWSDYQTMGECLDATT